jgi:hypothetical protein
MTINAFCDLSPLTVMTMNLLRYSLLLTLANLLFSFSSLSQAPNLGTAQNFAVFTAVGAFNNTGATIITGDIGTNVGAFNGFPPGVVIGNIHVADGISAQAATDVDLAYAAVAGMPCGSVLGVNLGSGQVLTPEIYCIGAAAVLNGTLVLDAEGDPGARFIFQIDGALSTATHTNILLVNGASACNVYWQINGAFNLGDFSMFVGTVLGNGAISLLEGSSLDGRALSRSGAVELHSNIVSRSLSPVPAFITADGAINFCEGDSVTLSGNIDGIWNTGDTSFSITVFVSGDYYVDNSNDCGIAISNHIIVTVTPDNTPPDITCPINITVECDESVLPENTGSASAIDDCDLTPIISYADVLNPGACPYNYEIVRTWTSVDIAGNESSCNQIITISDLSAPVLNCPSDIEITCTNPVTPEFTGVATATDNCDDDPAISYTELTITSACPANYTLIRTWIAVDNCGNGATCNQTISVMDNTAPAIVCPVDISITCTQDDQPSFTGEATATDNCDTDPVISYTDIQTPSGQCPQNYLISRTWTATDACNNVGSCIQTITSADVTAPVIDCPVSMSVDCNASILPGITGFASAMDDCDTDPAIDYADVLLAGECPEIIIVVRTWTATDACGNASTCQQNIYLSDDASPSISCPQDISIACTVEVPAPDIADVVASDNCGVPIVTFAGDEIVDQICPDRYTIFRTYLATDICDNTATCIQIITVNDLIAPVLTCPANVLVECVELIPAIDVSAISVSDNCGNLSTLSHLEDVQSDIVCSNQFLLTRTYRAIDDCGNEGFCTQVITVYDDVAPTIACPDGITVSCETDLPPADITLVVSEDNCDGIVIITLSSETISNQNCVNDFILARSYQAIDECGNIAVCTQLITVRDITPPAITCPSNVTLECTEGISPSETGFASATDNCGGDVLIDFSDASQSGECPELLSIMRTWTATDICGNVAQCEQIIVLTDETNPVITCPQDVNISCTSEVPLPDTDDVSASDNCGIPVITFGGDELTNQICEDRYTILRTYLATDICDNTATCIQIITVNDLIAPVLTCPANVLVECEDLIPAMDISGIAVFDNCGNSATVTHFGDVQSDVVCSNQFILTRTYQAIDACGNVGLCTQVITIFDDVAPAIICPDGLSVACAEDVPPADVSLVVAQDNCGGTVAVALTGEIVSGLNCENDYTLLRTYRATDDCGNTNECTQLIIVLDSIPPVITCPLFVTVACADQVSPEDITQVAISDNCSIFEVTILDEVISNQTCENGFTLTRTYQATDDCGNTATCRQIITVLDTIPPVIEFVDPRLIGLNPGDTLEVQCYGQDPLWDLPVFTVNSINASDICLGDVNVMFNLKLLAEGNCIEDGYIQLFLLTWTATDICGNISSASLFLKLVDTIPPVIVGIPDDITLDCEDLLLAPVNIIALDECLCACLVVSEQSVPQPGCQDGMVVTITWTAIDDCGNMTNETQYITLIDTVGPILEVVHPDIAGIENGTILEIQCNEYGFPRFVQEMTNESIFSPDVCGGAVIVVLDKQIIENVDCKVTGFIEERTFIWTATDLCSNSSTFSFSVRLMDTIPPVWVNVPDTVCIGSPLLTGIIAQDNCGEPYTKITDRSIPNPCGSGTAKQRKYQATDECGNTAVAFAIILPDDLLTPTILFINPDLEKLLPNETLIVECNAMNGRYTSFTAEDVYLYGICSTIGSATFVEHVMETRNCAADSIKAIVALIWTVTDVCGNSAARTLIAEIIDTIPPVFIGFNPEQTISCLSALPFIVAIDNCGEAIITSVDSIVPSNCILEYDIIRLITATDECGNMATMQQIIHIGTGDGPILSVMDEVICDDLSLPVVTAYDPCLEEYIKVTMTTDTLDTLCPGGLVIVRTWSAVDTCGRETVVTHTIIINDRTPPIISVPDSSDLFQFWNNHHNVVYLWQFKLMCLLDHFNAGSVIVFDDCYEGIIPVFTVDVIITEDCEEDGYYERRIYTWIATDICGNADTLTVIVDIVDDIPPVFLDFPYDITLYCVPLPPVPILNVEDYGFDVSIEFTESIGPGNEPGVVIVKRSWIAIDVCGNSTQQVQTITLIPDNNLVCEIILPVDVECNSHGVLIHSIITGGSGIMSYRWIVEGEKCFIQGGQGTPWIKIYVGWSPVKIILEVTDSLGCVSMCMIVLNCITDGMDIGDAIQADNKYISHLVPSISDAYVGIAPVIFSEMKIWPNPVSDEVNISFMADSIAPLEINLINLFGQRIKRETVITQVGMNLSRLNLNGVPEGNYVLKFVTDQQLTSINLIVLTK